MSQRGREQSTTTDDQRHSDDYNRQCGTPVLSGFLKLVIFWNLTGSDDNAWSQFSTIGFTCKIVLG